MESSAGHPTSTNAFCCVVVQKKKENEMSSLSREGAAVVGCHQMGDLVQTWKGECGNEHRDELYPLAVLEGRRRRRIY